jgi:DNA-binding NarL/FixJ family response regulator
VTGITVLCVEDQRTLLDALRSAVSAQPGLACVGTAETVAAALDLLDLHRPDVVLMDVDLPGPDGIVGTRLVKRAHPSTRVVVLTGGESAEALVRAAAAGADAFLSKASSLTEILAALRVVETGGIHLDKATLDVVRERVAIEARVEGRLWDPGLTEREREVLALLAHGVDPKGIARQLGITLHTTRSYIRNVLTKLRAHSQLEAVVVAARAGMLRGVLDAPG